MTDGKCERSLARIVERLGEAGYADSFRGEEHGIRSTATGVLHQPEEMIVEAIERFEGTSDPEDEAIVLALLCPLHGCRGTYVVAYGAEMPALDGDLIARIPDGRHR